MSRNVPSTPSDSAVRAELLFLIARFLSNTPCQQAADVLLQELRTHELLPKGVDWEGNERPTTYEQLVRVNSHIGADYLLQIVRRVGPLLDQLVPSATYGVQSLLSAGSMSLLRTPKSLKRNYWKLSHLMALQNGSARVIPNKFIQPSMVQRVHAWQAVGSGMGPLRVPTSQYAAMKQYGIKCGHLLATYCSIFDRTGTVVITGADDALVKIWHFHSGRLLATLRGHSGEVSDLDVNYENTLVVSGSYDKVVRVWCLQTKAPVAVLQGHTSMITTVQFSPQCKGETRILMTTGADGCVCFWLYNINTNCFNPKPKKFVERSNAGAKMLCAAFSTGGNFAATGSSDHVVRVYFLYAAEPTKICELEAHNDMIGCINYANCSNRFISGSDDGTARIWHYERQDWKDTVLNMNTTIIDGKEVSPDEAAKFARELNVTIVTWNLDDSMVVTAVVGLNIDYVRLKVWETASGRLRHDLRGHTQAVYVLDAHPVDRRVLLSSGHDGVINIWDIWDGVKLCSFSNRIEGQGAIPVFDCKFTPDGQGMTASDSFGQVIFFGMADNKKINEVPLEVFFHTDYRPLMRDANNFVLDEETQLAPHLMPPPYLVNVVGSPYPPALQRLVPGREHMPDSKLVPHYIISDHGFSVVIGDGEDADRVMVNFPPGGIPHPELGQDSDEEEEEQRYLPNNQRNNQRQNQRQNVNNRQVNQRQRVSNRRQSAPPHLDHHDLQQRRPGGRSGSLQQQQQQQPRAVMQPQDHDYSRHHNANNDDHDTEEERVEVHWNGQHARSSIDELIRQLQQEQDERILAEGGELPMASPPHPPATHRDRSGSLEGGGEGRRHEEQRQEGGGGGEAENGQAPPVQAVDTCALHKRVVVYPLSKGELRASQEKRIAMGEEEIRRFILERKKKQSVPNTPSTLFGNMSRGRQDVRAIESENSGSKQASQSSRNRLATRALYDTEEEETEESESESESSYSDWTMEGSSNLQPPKRRSKRKPKRRRLSSSEDEDDDEEAELAIEYADDDDDDDDNDDEDFKVYLKPSKKGEKKEEEKEDMKKKTPMLSQDKKEKKPYKTVKRKQKDSGDCAVSASSTSQVKKSEKSSKRKNNYPQITELKPEFLPPEWVTGTIPRKSPFVPQMGDEVMYFRQGHELYLQAVERHKSYEISSNLSLPWQKNPHLREMELMKIVGIRYEVKPPRLCSLKLAYVNPDNGKMLGGSLSVRYHDMPDVIDFLVLRQLFDLACQRRWKPGERFRSMIDDQWWMGRVESQSPLNPMFPDSMFQCFIVQWDNGESERLSPWDMEPVNENSLPSGVGEGVSVDPEELKGMLYKPRSHEWSSASYEEESQRIICGLEAVMEHSAALPFNSPVDLNAFPTYAVVIEYPIDLSTIKARLENGYYRRINALQWDVRHIESNAKKFNEDGAPIALSASIITDTLLKFISDATCHDPMPILRELSQGMEFNWNKTGGPDHALEAGEGEDSAGEGTSSGTSSAAKRKPSAEWSIGGRIKRQRMQANPLEWRKDCQELLDNITQHDDAAPFLSPVDLDVYPNYNNVIQTPMDFGTVRGRLESSVYSSPVEFTKDVRLIFHNSRTFNTNRKSRIYAMTARLSSLFESLVHRILASWRALTKNKSSAGSAVNFAVAEEISQQAGGSSARSRDSSSQETMQPSISQPGPSSESRSHTSGRSSEEDMRTLARNMVPRPADDTDSEKTEVEDDKDEDNFHDKRPLIKRERKERRYNVDDDNNDDDEDTEIEDNSNTSTSSAGQNVSSPGASQQHSSGPSSEASKSVTYRTRAKTGSLRPKRYVSSEEEDDRDVRKNGKRAASHSSRDSSFQHDIDDAEDSTESSTETESTSDSESSTSKQRKHLSKLVRSKRRNAASKSRRKKTKKVVHTDSEMETEEEETSETSSDSDIDVCPPPRKVQPRRRPQLVVDTNTTACPSKKPSGSGKRTTRNQGKRTFNYLEDSCDDYEDDPSCLSVSSRGRVRKMTKRARANKVDD